MKDFLKKLIRPLLYLILSVFVLSVPIGNRTLFFYAHEILVENQLVAMVSKHCSAIYDQLSERVRLALIETAAPKEKPTR